MDARTDSRTIPLAVDLDGTLIATDLLWESLFLLIRQNPLYLFMVPVWLAGGKARLKCEIASRVELDPAALPYRPEILQLIDDAKHEGRKVVLATASPEKFADAVADHLGLFDAVISTRPALNLASAAKKAALVESYGEAGFDYVGNSRADLQIFDAARQAIVVAPDRNAARWQKRHEARLIETPKPGVKTLLKMLRVHQWVKNVLIFVPMALSHEYLNIDVILGCVIAFFAFSAAASSIYIVNDFFDLALDRAHPTKRNRPFASGMLSMPFGIGAAAVLLVTSLALGLLLPPLFMLVLVGYLIATTAYSLALKRMLLVDVLTLAGLYTVRVLAGAASSPGLTVSFWLLAFSIFFFLSLALVKRYVELRMTALPEGERIAGRGYRTEDQEIIAQAGLASSFSAALVLALYMQSDTISDLYVHPWMIWPLSPIILYLTMRIWILARRDEMHDDPIVFIIRDWRSQTVAILGALLLVAGTI